MARPRNDVHDVWLEHKIHLLSRTILLSGPVNEEMKTKVLLAKRMIDAEKQTVTVELDTEGGDCYEGISIYDCLRSFKARVEIVGFGKVMSMGIFIMQAADPGGRLLMPNSTVMVHQGHSDSPSDHPETLQRNAKEDRRIRARMDRIVYERTKPTASPKLTLKEFVAKHQFDNYYSPVHAICAGLADRILTP
jgi:ATP-dependent Clp protease protease subunit